MSIRVSVGGFTFVQSTPSTTWTINHSFGRHPIIDVVISHEGEDTVVLPLLIQHNVDLTQVIITFSSVQAGSARLG